MFHATRERNKRPWALALLTLGLLPVLAGCPGGGDAGLAVPSNVSVRVVNASDVPVDATIDKFTFHNLQFGEDSPYVQQHIGANQTLTVNPVGANNILLTKNVQIYKDESIVLAGPSTTMSAFEVFHSPRSGSTAEVQVLYAGQRVGNFDAYLLNANQNINTAIPINNSVPLSINQRGPNNSGFQQKFAPDTYTFTFTQRGSKTPLTQLGPVTLRGNERYIIVVTDDPNDATKYNATLVTESSHKLTSAVEVANATQDPRNLNLTSQIGTISIGSVGQGSITPITVASPGNSPFVVHRGQSQVYNQFFQVAADQRTVFVLLDTKDPNNVDVSAVTFSTTTNVPFGNSTIAFVNGLTTPAAVDAYVVPAGTGITGVTPAGTNLAYGQNVQLQVPHGNYQVILTEAGNANNVIATSSTVFLEAGDYRIVTAVPGAQAGQVKFQQFASSTRKAGKTAVLTNARRH